MTTTATDLLKQANEALARVEQEKALVREEHRQELATFDDEIKLLKAAVRALEGTRARPGRPAAVQAGPAALAKIRAVLSDGPLTQSQITKQTSLNDGTVSYGLRALADQGEIEATGVRINGSREFRLRMAKQSAA